MYIFLKYFLIFKIILLLTFNVFAAEDPFSRSFTVDQEEVVESQAENNDAKEKEDEEDVDDSVHPLIRYDLNKYFVKGVVKSELGNLAIISFPSGRDYIMFSGDPLGNNMYVITDIKLDYIVLSSNDGDQFKISVMNEASLMDEKQDQNDE
jgi:Tfp pilus assembly protein PilP